MQDMKVNLMYIVSEGILLNLNFMATFYGQRFPNSGNRWRWGWVNPHHSGVEGIRNFTGAIFLPGKRNLILTI